MGASNPNQFDTVSMRAGILGLIAIGLLTLAALAYAVSSLAAETGEPVADFDARTPVELTGAPGEELHFRLERENVLRYATYGLTLHLAGKAVEVAPPVEKTWDEAVSGDVDDIDVGITVRVPDVAPGQMIEGTITGEVTFAEPEGGGTFGDWTSGVQVPVRVHVVTPQESAAFVAARRGDVGMIVMPALVVATISGVAGLVALLVAIVLGLWVTRHTPFSGSRSTGEKRAWHVVAAGMGALIAGVSLVVGVVFAIAWLNGPRHDPLSLAAAAGLVVMAVWALVAAREQWVEHRGWPAGLLALGMLGGGVVALTQGAQRSLPSLAGFGDRSIWEFALFLMLGVALALSTSVGLGES